MTTAIQTTRAGAFWNDADVALVRAKCAKDVTDQEWKLFLHLANLYQLDPLARQIYCLKYGDKPAQIFAGIDGFLAIAQRSERLDGMEVPCRVEPVPFTVSFYDNRKKEQVTVTQDTQFVATATVWVRGWGHPVRVEIWEEEYSTGRDLWATKRRTMTAKVALCQALRKAFNISGLYDRDEVGDSAPPDVLTVDAMEVDPHTGEITAPTAKLPPQRAVVAQDATQAQGAPPRTPPPATGTAPGDPKTRVKREVHAQMKAFDWTPDDLLKVMCNRVHLMASLEEAGLKEWEQLRDVLAAEGLAAHPAYADFATLPGRVPVGAA